jgi:hypothetical protein
MIYIYISKASHEVSVVTFSSALNALAKASQWQLSCLERRGPGGPEDQWAGNL